MTNKKHVSLLKDEFAELNSIRRMRVAELTKQVRKGVGNSNAKSVVDLLLEWRRSRPNYELSAEEAAEIAHQFEVAGSSVVEAKDSPAALAFRSAGLDPRQPHHWLFLVDGMAKILMTRKRRKLTKRAPSALKEIKADAEVIRGANPDIRKEEVVRRLKKIRKEDGKLKHTQSETTLMRLLTAAGVNWFTRPKKKRRAR